MQYITENMISPLKDLKIETQKSFTKLCPVYLLINWIILKGKKNIKRNEQLWMPLIKLNQPNIIKKISSKELITFLKFVILFILLLISYKLYYCI